MECGMGAFNPLFISVYFDDGRMDGWLGLAFLFVWVLFLLIALSKRVWDDLIDWFIDRLAHDMGWSDRQTERPAGTGGGRHNETNHFFELLHWLDLLLHNVTVIVTPHCDFTLHPRWIPSPQISSIVQTSTLIPSIQIPPTCHLVHTYSSYWEFGIEFDTAVQASLSILASLLP